MKGHDSGLAHGTIGSPQTSLDQGEYAEQVRENERQLKAAIATDELIDEELVHALEQSKEKFAREDMVFITRDKTGQIIWLEQGNSLAGLEHITKRGHDKELAKAFGVAESDVIKFLRDVVKNGDVVSNRIRKVGNRDGYERVYDYGGRYVVLTAIGLNGFLVSAFPVKRKG